MAGADQREGDDTLEELRRANRRLRGDLAKYRDAERDRQITDLRQMVEGLNERLDRQERSLVPLDRSTVQRASYPAASYGAAKARKSRGRGRKGNLQQYGSNALFALSGSAIAGFFGALFTTINLTGATAVAILLAAIIAAIAGFLLRVGSDDDTLEDEDA